RQPGGGEEAQSVALARLGSPLDPVERGAELLQPRFRLCQLPPGADAPADVLDARPVAAGELQRVVVPVLPGPQEDMVLVLLRHAEADNVRVEAPRRLKVDDPELCMTDVRDRH